MNAFIRKTFFSEPTGPVPGFRYVALTLLVSLFVGSIALAITQRHPTFERYFMPLFSLWLLLEHLTSQFRWQRSTFVFMRCVGLISGVSALIYFCFCVPSWFRQ
jgi:hypothetical protein